MNKWILFLAFNISISALAEQPDWVNKKSFEDAKNYYFVESLQAEQLNQTYARESLRQQAVQEAIRQVIGTESKFVTNTVATAHKADVATTSTELYPNVEVKNFTEQSISIISDKAYFLYAWPKADANLALEKAKTAAKVAKHSLRALALVKSTVVLTTEPEGAEVFIDDLRWGTTPLTLTNKLAFGRHKYRIEHKRFKTEEFEDVLVDSERSIHRVLAPLELEMTFTTNPEGAKLFIDGEFKGLTPVTLPFLVTDDNYKKLITTEHEHAVTQTFQIELSKDSPKVTHIELLLNASKLYFNCEPRPCQYSVGNMTGVTKGITEKVSLSPGSYVITFTKEGYKTKAFSIEIEAGIDFGLNTVVLVKDEDKNIDFGTYLRFQLGVGLAGGDFILDKDVSYLNLDANFSLILLHVFVFNVGGSVTSFEDDKDFDNQYSVTGKEVYHGFGLNILDVRLLSLFKHRTWSIDYSYPHKTATYDLGLKAIKLDMPVSKLVRWNIEYSEIESATVRHNLESSYAVGVGFEF